RNVALNEKTQQSSTYLYKGTIPGSSSKAVDGSVFTNSKHPSVTCSHTKDAEMESWNLTFVKPVELYKMELNNRWDDCCKERLIGFTLHTLDPDHKLVFDFTDQEEDALRNYVIIPDTRPKENVKFIEIIKSKSGLVLTLCEVFAFG
ncbi:fucolectin, partial [Plakobranchus ocellatus]